MNHVAEIRVGAAHKLSSTLLFVIDHRHLEHHILEVPDGSVGDIGSVLLYDCAYKFQPFRIVLHIHLVRMQSKMIGLSNQPKQRYRLQDLFLLTIDNRKIIDIPTIKLEQEFQGQVEDCQEEIGKDLTSEVADRQAEVIACKEKRLDTSQSLPSMEWCMKDAVLLRAVEYNDLSQI